MKWMVLVILTTAVSWAWADSDSATSTGTATASEGSTTSEIKDILRDKKFDEDTELNDLELRAYNGSLNRYSLQFSLGYSGPPVNNISDPNRPNPSNLNGDYRTDLSGSASMRYRLTSDMGVNVGTGLVWYTPYQAVINQPVVRRTGLDTYDVSDPYASWDVSYVSGPVQMRSAVSVEAVTTKGYVIDGEWGEAAINQYFKYTPFHTRWILGFQGGVDYFAYDRPYDKYDGKASKYWINIIPSVEYKLTDKLNFNTSLGVAYQNLRSRPDWTAWAHPESTWRVGVGWAITHDIYINPYINFYAESPSLNTASASFNTTFSIF